MIEAANGTLRIKKKIFHVKKQSQRYKLSPSYRREQRVVFLVEGMHPHYMTDTAPKGKGPHCAKRQTDRRKDRGSVRRKLCLPVCLSVAHILNLPYENVCPSVCLFVFWCCGVLCYHEQVKRFRLGVAM